MCCLLQKMLSKIFFNVSPILTLTVFIIRAGMGRLNDLIMAILSGILLLTVNQYLPLAALINLIFNFFMIIILVVYIMQFLALINPVLPSPKIFK